MTDKSVPPQPPPKDKKFLLFILDLLVKGLENVNNLLMVFTLPDEIPFDAPIS